jgi:hypothetical protein
MDELKPEPLEGVTAPAPYEPPAVEKRLSSRDPLVWTVSSPVVC